MTFKNKGQAECAVALIKKSQIVGNLLCLCPVIDLGRRLL
jgi:hypothetical protein